MSITETEPGSATLDELRVYWRLPSLRAARELARSLNVRRVKQEYPWLAIWAAEGLAPPSKTHWEALKLPHCTTADIGEILGMSRRQAQRLDDAKPDQSFPDPLGFREKPKLWRRTQVLSWVVGAQVQQFKLAQRRRPAPHQLKPAPPHPDHGDAVFNPFAEIRSADRKNNEMT
ncbi:MAG: hypothetical protein QUV10_13870 [Paracoccaceae bacterium]|nr:hypothetical protein [Paracoccaceae bacterium]